VRILVLTQFFTPEIGATSTRLHTFAAGLAAMGHDVEVVCELPNHPQGVVHDAYRGGWVRRARLDGFHVTWVWVRTVPDKRSRDRLAFYATYATSAAAWGAVTTRPDLVFVSSPPLPAAASAAALSRLRRVPWVLDVRDLWPDVAVALGELTDRRLVRFARRLEHFLYNDAAAITTVTEPFRRHIRSHVDPSTDVALIPNGTTSLWLDVAQRTPDRGALGLPQDRFVWTFAGNLGLAQDLRTAVAAAKLLGSDFQLLLLGDGAAKGSLEAQAARLPPGCVVFRPQVPAHVAADFLRASDALLVPLAPDPMLASFVPSKLFDCCATGVPVVVAAAGEPARIATASDAALAVSPGDAAQLAAAVGRLRDDTALRDRLAENGRRFARENLREHHVSRLEAVLVQANSLSGKYARARRRNVAGDAAL